MRLFSIQKLTDQLNYIIFVTGYNCYIRHKFDEEPIKSSAVVYNGVPTLYVEEIL